MSFTIDASEVLRDLDRFERDANKAIDEQFDAIGRNVRDIVKGDSSFGGNRLRLAIAWAKQTDDTLRVFTWPGPQYKHASFINDGTRAHLIRARRTKSLAFMAGGRMVFRKVVRHPGTKPTHYFDNAVETAFDQAFPDLERRLEPAIQRFNRG